jgi:hypothetical protein
MKKLVMGVCFAALLIALPVHIMSVDRGSVAGVVKAADGAPLTDAKVKISGAPLPAGREYTTGKDGAFRFLSLLPGKYTVEITHPRAIDLTVDVTVGLDRETQVAAVMTMIGKIEEEVTVRAATPIIDVKSTEISTNWVKQDVSNLPLGRSYSNLLQLAPGVAENRDFAPNAGGNKQDNVYLYDGANITNPGFGYLGANFSELDIQEVNIKRGALSAEFGRAAGMVTNAITKSGTNQLSGTLRMVFEPSGFTWKSRDPNIVTKYNVTTPTLGLGGPIIKDRLWWYASANLPYSKTTGRINLVGAVPDAKNTSNEFFVKLNANPHANHQIMISFRNNDYKQRNAGIGVNDHPATATDNDGLDRIFYGSWTWIISPTTYLDVKYDHVDEKSKSSPVTNLGYKPTFNPANLDKMGYFQTAAGYIIGGAKASGQYVGGGQYYNTQNYYRDEIKLVFSKYLDFPGHSHLIKAGFGFDDGGEYLDRISNGWGAIIVTKYAGKTAFRARYYEKQPPQDSRGRTYSIFLQDAVTIGNRLTINAGVLVNRDEFSTQTAGDRKVFLKFNFDKEIQPRLGVTYIVDRNAQDKLFANYGRYFCMDNKSLARAAAPLRIYRRDAYLDLAGNVLSDVPQASETGKVILSDIRPTYQDEFVVGYSRPITRKWVVDLWGQYRTVSDVIEDYPTLNRETSPSSYVYGNLDGKTWTLPSGKQITVPKAERIYKAFTIQVQRPFSDRWSLNLAYTWSRLSGNWDLDYAAEALFYASSYIEDAPGLYLSDPNRTGLFAGDRTHLIKLFFTWEFYQRTFLGVYWRIQSGRPWEPRSRDYYGNYYRYLEKAGSHRFSTWGNLDIQVSHALPVSGRLSVQVEARLMNALDTQTVMMRDIRQDQPTYLIANSYASPRKFVLSFFLNF